MAKFHEIAAPSGEKRRKGLLLWVLWKGKEKINLACVLQYTVRALIFKPKYIVSLSIGYYYADGPSNLPLLLPYITL